MQDLLKTLGGGEMVFGDATTAKAEIQNDSGKGLFVLKLKDNAISEGINYLKGKGLFPDKVEDSDDECVFGDDDFPQADQAVAEEGSEEVAEEAAPESSGEVAEDTAEPYPDISYGAATPERLTGEK